MSVVSKKHHKPEEIISKNMAQSAASAESKFLSIA